MIAWIKINKTNPKNNPIYKSLLFEEEFDLGLGSADVVGEVVCVSKVVGIKDEGFVGILVGLEVAWVVDCAVLLDGDSCSSLIVNCAEKGKNVLSFIT